MGCCCEEEGGEVWEEGHVVVGLTVMLMRKYFAGADVVDQDAVGRLGQGCLVLTGM